MALSDVSEIGGHAAHIYNFAAHTRYTVDIICSKTKYDKNVKKLAMLSRLVFRLYGGKRLYLRATPVFLFVIWLLKPFSRDAVKQIAWEINGSLTFENRIGGHSKMLSALNRFFERRLISEFKTVICVSAGVTNYYREAYKLENVYTVDNGYPTNLLGLNRDKSKRNRNIITVGYIGLFTEWQDFDSCLKFVRLLSEEAGIVKFVVYGHGPSKSDWYVKARASGIDVDWKGVVAYNSIAEAYEGIDIGLVPDRRITKGAEYSSPIKLVEYIAANIIPIYVDERGCIDPASKEYVTVTELLYRVTNPMPKEYLKMIENKSWKDVVNRVENIVGY